jgi:hypothetical protein
VFSDDMFEHKFITVGEALTDYPESNGSKSPQQQQQLTAAEKAAEALYDVPRSNRRVSSTAAPALPKQLEKQLEKQLASEAIYVNDDFEGSGVESTYDVPRNDDFAFPVPDNYDVARTRDSLSTIEEEHQVRAGRRQLLVWAEKCKCQFLSDVFYKLNYFHFRGTNGLHSRFVNFFTALAM